MPRTLSVQQKKQIIEGNLESLKVIIFNMLEQGVEGENPWDLVCHGAWRHYEMEIERRSYKVKNSGNQSGRNHLRLIK